jgi:hypothetical protein
MFLVVGMVAAFQRSPALFFGPGFFLLFMGCINLWLLKNYYRFMKNKVLVISKGHDTFWYGDLDNPTQYSKQDIESVIIVSSQKAYSRRSMWSDFVIYKIHFSNNAYPIAFTSLLIDEFDFRNKISAQKQQDEFDFYPLFPGIDV